MSKYEFFGSGCGSGTSYTVKRDGEYYGTDQPSCPDIPGYFKSGYAGNELWLNGIKISGTSGTSGVGAGNTLMYALVAVVLIMLYFALKR